MDPLAGSLVALVVDTEPQAGSWAVLVIGTEQLAGTAFAGRPGAFPEEHLASGPMYPGPMGLQLVYRHLRRRVRVIPQSVKMAHAMRAQEVETRRCFTCNQPGHLQRDHWKYEEKNGNGPLQDLPKASLPKGTTEKDLLPKRYKVFSSDYICVQGVRGSILGLEAGDSPSKRQIERSSHF